MIPCRQILWPVCGLDGRDGQGDVAVAEHAESAKLLGGGLCGVALLPGRIETACLKCVRNRSSRRRRVYFVFNGRL